MMHNKDNQFIINSCCCAKEEEYSDDDEADQEALNNNDSEATELKSDHGGGKGDMRKDNGLDYAVLFEQEAMNIN